MTLGAPNVRMTMAFKLFSSWRGGTRQEKYSTRLADLAKAFGALSFTVTRDSRSKSNMAGYKLATYQSADGPRAGLVVDEHVFDAALLTRKPAYATVLGILNDWKSAQAALKKAVANSAKSRAKSRPLARTKLLAPVLWPSAIYCAGANYADHAAEMNRAHNRPPEPDPHTLGLQSWHFIKASRSLANPGATIKLSDYSKMM